MGGDRRDGLCGRQRRNRLPGPHLAAPDNERLSERFDIDPCWKWSVYRSSGNNNDHSPRAGAQPNQPISGHRYTRGLAAWRCPNSVVFVLISLWRHSSERRGSRSYLVGGLERDPAPVQKKTEHIE